MQPAFSRHVLCAVAGACISAMCLPATAADDELTLEEVLVTAQKREQSLQEVPASVSAVTGDMVDDYLGSAENVRALAGRVPSLNVESSNGRTQPRFYIRGLGNIDFDNNANQPVSMVYDDIALENNVLRSLPLFDINRVEVLKGPQGSLFGRNTNAGIVKIDSVRPSADAGGYVRLGVGSRETIMTEAAFNGSLTENTAARLSLKFQEREDWIDNTVNGIGDDFGGFEEFAYRLQFLMTPGENFTGLVKLHGFQQRGTHPQVFYANALVPGAEGLRAIFDEEVASHDAGAGTDLDHFGTAINLQWDLGESTFTSITGYDMVENFQFADVDGGNISFDPADIGELGRQVFFGVATGDGLADHHQLTQEFRLSGQSGNRFYQVGVYFFDEEIDVLSRDFGFNSSDIVNQQTTSAALFGQMEVPLNDAWAVTFGGRYTSDDKKLEVMPGPNSASPADRIDVDDSYFNWDVALSFDANENWNWFARAANASRGPVTLGRFGFTSSADTETATSLELGFKSRLFDGRARFNGAIYNFTVDDQQLTATGGVANVNQLLNADKVNGFGVESEFEMLVSENLRLMTNISYNDTEIDDPGLKDDLCGSNPQCTPLDPIVGSRIGPFGPVTEVSIDGNPLPRSPQWLYNITLDYNRPMATGGEFYASTDWNYRDDSNLFLHESIEFVAEERWLG
ncbi:MAG: TonB-dependent receptor, partial [Gammaproteobacteria bacterium]|nr:TonB-dependent receptor [Gammaproteobacteria bacterium]